MSTVPELFESFVARFGELPAVVDDKAVLCYDELNERANRLARCLVVRGVGPDSIVAVAVPKSNDLMVTILAVLKAGGAYLPLDPAYPAERLSSMIADSRPVLLIRTSAVVPLDPELSEFIVDDPAIDRMCAGMPSHDLAHAERRAPLRADHLMYVIYTSGSTGTPKGVAVPHSGVPHMMATQHAILGAGPGDRVLQWASISFDAAFWDVTLALLSGATLVLAPPDDLLPGLPLYETLLRFDITHVVLPPAALSETAADGVLIGGTVMSTGDSCTPTLVRKWSTGRRMFNGYGPTEVTVGATVGGPIREGEEVDIGTPWIGNQVHVLDERLQSAGPGPDGEFYIAGSGLARGYLNRPAATAVKFVPDPFGPPGSRMYRTGDRGRSGLGGNLYFAGRTDGQVKLRGFRIELGEIETRLANHPAVNVAVAVVRGGVADANVVAYVTTGSPVDVAELRAHVARSLPAHMVPARIVLLDRLPTLANGKIDRAALPAVEPTAGPQQVDLADGYAAILCAMVRDLLVISQARPGDNFFELGGHSVQATRLATRIRDELGIRIPIRAVLEAATIGDLAAAVENAAAQRG